jgi:hypothetical protein
VVAGVGTTARAEAVGLVGHFVDLDLGAGGVVAVHIPSFVAHVTDREEVDGAIAFAEDYTVVDVVLRLDESCVDRDIK